MPSYLKSDFDKMFIDESYKAFKRDDLKVVCSIKINNDQKPKKIISKITKLDENNQYGFVMPMGVIKEKPSSNWKTFNLLLESVSIDDPTGHLFAVDKKFDYENATKKQVLFNEILPPVIEKHKILDVNERSTFQLLEHFEKTNKGTLKPIKAT